MSPLKGYKATDEHKKHNSESAKRRLAEGRNSTVFKKGHIPTEEMCKTMGARGEKHYMWKGGISLDKNNYHRELRNKNIEHYRAYFREWKKNHRDSVNAYTQNYRTILRNAKGKFTPREWVIKKLEYGNTCAVCGKSGKLTIDHIIPLSKGGTNDIDNIQPLCPTCNYTKSDMLMEEFVEYMERKDKDVLIAIKELLKHDWEDSNKTFIETGDMQAKDNCEYIRYLQDQIAKLEQ